MKIPFWHVDRVELVLRGGLVTPKENHFGLEKPLGLSDYLLVSIFFFYSFLINMDYLFFVLKIQFKGTGMAIPAQQTRTLLLKMKT